MPGTCVLGAIRVVLHEDWWRPLLGVVLLVPAVILWGGTLLFAFAGFRIH